MADREKHFEIDGFRFRLCLKSASVEAHSLMTYENNGQMLQVTITNLAQVLEDSPMIIDMIKKWKEEHK